MPGQLHRGRPAGCAEPEHGRRQAVDGQRQHQGVRGPVVPEPEVAAHLRPPRRLVLPPAGGGRIHQHLDLGRVPGRAVRSDRARPLAEVDAVADGRESGWRAGPLKSTVGTVRDRAGCGRLGHHASGHCRVQDDLAVLDQRGPGRSRGAAVLEPADLDLGRGEFGHPEVVRARRDRMRVRRLAEYRAQHGGQQRAAVHRGQRAGAGHYQGEPDVRPRVVLSVRAAADGGRLIEDRHPALSPASSRAGLGTTPEPRGHCLPTEG